MAKNLKKINIKNLHFYKKVIIKRLCLNTYTKEIIAHQFLNCNLIQLHNLVLKYLTILSLNFHTNLKSDTYMHAKPWKMQYNLDMF